MPKGYAVGDGFIMSPGSKMNTGGDFRKLFVKGGAGRDIKIRPTEFTENEFKDISSTGKGFKDVYRIIESFFGKKAPEIKKRVLVPLEQGKKQMFKNLEGHVRGLELIVKMGFKKGSKMSADLQRFGEGTFTKSQVVEKYGKDKLGNFIHADRWFRKQYDKLLDEVNSVRAKIYPNQPDKIIPKRKDYYRHFQEMQEGLGALANIFEAPSGISQGLAGISQFTKPKSKWLSFAQKRMGRKTTEDATGGFINYVQQAEYAKNIDPAIVNFRKLQETITRTGEKTGQNFNNMIEFLQDYADDLAGKTNPLDRGVQKYIPGGRTIFKVLDWLNKRVKANVILGNASSSLAQIFNVPQGISSAGEKNFLKGLARLGLSIGKDDSVMRQSTFLKERYFKGFDKFDTGILNNTKKFAAWMVTVLDELGTKSIWNAHYEKALAEKISNPINYADDITRKMVAGRGIGEVPIAQKSKLFQMVAPFQLEVTNVWHVLGDFGRNKEAGKILKFFVYSYLFNRAIERVRGSDVGLDPINALIEGVKAYNEEDDKKKGAMMATGRMAGEVLSNIPGGQTLAAMYPEYGFSVGDKNFPTRSELFGKGDPTRFGSGILIAKGIQDPISKIISPFGGVQAKRSIEGVKSFMEGSAKTKSGNVMYPVEQTPRNFLQSFAFGKYSTPQAREYFEDNRQPLGENQTKIFEMAGKDYYNKVMADRNTEAEKRKLSRKYEKDFEARSDEILKDKLSKLLVHPEFQKLSEDKKQNMIESYISKSNSLAKAQMIAEMTKGMNEEQLRAKLRELKREGFLTKEAYDTFRKYYYQ